MNNTKLMTKKASAYSKQELMFVVQQFKEKNVRKDQQIEKLRKKISECELKLYQSQKTQENTKRKNLLPMSHQRNPVLEDKVKYMNEELNKQYLQTKQILKQTLQVKSLLEGTNQHLRQTNNFKLLFLSFYKDFSNILQTSCSLESFKRLSQQYKFNTLNLDMDESDRLVTSNMD